jgi:hypothetical protein
MAFGKTEFCILISEAICILFYGLFTEFAPSAAADTDYPDKASEDMFTHYPMF